MFKTINILAILAILDSGFCAPAYNGPEIILRRHDIPITDALRVFGSIGEVGPFSGKAGVSADIYKNGDGKLTGEVYRAVGPDLQTIIDGGSLSWNSDAIRGGIAAGKLPNSNNPRIAVNGEATLWKPLQNIELVGSASAFLTLFSGLPDITAGLNFRFNP